MNRIGIRDLSNNASEVLRTVTETGQPVLITNRGRAVAALVPVQEVVVLEDSAMEQLRQADLAVESVGQAVSSSPRSRA